MLDLLAKFSNKKLRHPKKTQETFFHKKRERARIIGGLEEGYLLKKNGDRMEQIISWRNQCLWWTRTRWQTNTGYDSFSSTFSFFVENQFPLYFECAYLLHLDFEESDWEWRIKWKPWIHSGDAHYFSSGFAEVSVSADRSTQTSEEATTTKASSSSIPVFQTVDEYGIAVGGEIEVQIFSRDKTHKKRLKTIVNFILLKESL